MDITLILGLSIFLYLCLPTDTWKCKFDEFRCAYYYQNLLICLDNEYVCDGEDHCKIITLSSYIKNSEGILFKDFNYTAEEKECSK